MNQVAKTILEQLGGGRFALVTGAKNFLDKQGRGLFFTLPGAGGFCKSGINRVEIMLENDTYRVTFYRARAGKMTVVQSTGDVYVENLIDVFESATGLVARMPKIRMVAG